MDLKEQIRIVLNHKNMIILISLFSTLFATLGYFIIPAKYAASTTVYMKPEAARLLIEKGVSKNLTQTSHEGQQYISQTYKELLKGRFLFERTVRILNLDKPRESSGFRKKIQDLLKPIITRLKMAFYYTLYGKYNPDPFEEAVGALTKKGVKVKQNLKTYLYTITAKNKDPKLAADIANTIATEFVKYSGNINSSETRSYRKFLEQRVKILGIELDQAEKNLKEFKDQYRIADLKEETKLGLSSLSSFQKSLDQVNAEIREMKTVQEEITTNKYSGRKEGDTIRSSTEKENSLLDQLRKDLAKSEIELSSLEEKYTDSNRKIVELKVEVATTKEKINKQVGEIMDSLEAKKKSLENVVRKYESVIQLAPTKEKKLDELKRAVKVAEDAYLKIKDQYEDARIEESKKLNEIRVFDTAKPPLYPKRPMQLLCPLLGLMSGLMVSIGFAFLIEYMDDTIRSIEAAEKILGYSVLTTIPNFQHSRWKKLKS